MRTLKTGLLVALSAIGLAGIARAESAIRLSDVNDRKFVEEAATGGMAEVKLGKLALDRAQSQEVKDFARRMIEDHSKADRELKHLMMKGGMTFPTERETKQMTDYQKMSRLSGDEFDRAYMDNMVKDHDQVVREFQNESSRAVDDSLRAWAGKTLPTLIEHQQMAHRIFDNLKKR